MTPCAQALASLTSGTAQRCLEARLPVVRLAQAHRYYLKFRFQLQYENSHRPGR